MLNEDVIKRLDEAKGETSEFKYLNDQCKDMFCSVLLLKKIKKKITETEQKEDQKKETTERKYKF